MNKMTKRETENWRKLTAMFEYDNITERIIGSGWDSYKAVRNEDGSVTIRRIKASSYSIANTKGSN